ncbi:MAG: hypothetical protein WCK34_06720 [Bacteroidota bacterium]
MKIKILAVLFLVIAGGLTSSGQQPGAKINVKNDQADLCNDFHLSYGMGSLFYWVKHKGLSATGTTGSFMAGYGRSLNEVVTVGFQMSYCHVDRGDQNQLGSGKIIDPSSQDKYTVTDNYLQGIAFVRFRYLNRQAFCMYSGVGLGVTMDYCTENQSGTTPYSVKSHNLLPSIQLTLLGFRVGRALGLFGEFGFGTNAILNAGVSYKFGKNE